MDTHDIASPVRLGAALAAIAVAGLIAAAAIVAADAPPPRPTGCPRDASPQRHAQRRDARRAVLGSARMRWLIECCHHSIQDTGVWPRAATGAGASPASP
jgi:hypothetical protein